MGLFSKSDYNIGFKGSVEEISARAQVSQSYDKKLKVIEGCVDAYLDGKPDNIRAFFAAYLDHKRSLGNITGPCPATVDSGFTHLLAEPFLNLVEKNADHWKAINSLTEGLAPFYKDLTLALALRHARAAGLWPSTTSYLETIIDIDDTGRKGPPAKIRMRAGFDISWGYKTPLLRDCIKTYDEGNLEHLKAFIGGYLEFKRSNGHIEKMRTSIMDDGIRGLFTVPVVQLLEKSGNPTEAVRGLLSDFNDYYRQIALNLLLREATSEGNSWFVASALLDAGADPNADGGRPLVNAVNKGDEKVITLLYRFGADFDMVPAFAEQSCKDFTAKAAAWKSRLSGKNIPVAPPANTNIPAGTHVTGKGPRKLEL